MGVRRERRAVSDHVLGDLPLPGRRDREVEAAGGVERWTDAAKSDPALAESLERATAEQRELRAELAGGERGPDEGASLELGIGGSSNPEQLKCLHAHAAFALARPGYELGERILAEVVPLWPEKCCLDVTDRDL